MSTYNYAPGAVHLDFHHNNISMSASTITDLVRSFISDRAEDITPDNTSASAQDNRSEDILPIPQEGKYSKVREYIKERCRFDDEFKTFVRERSLRDLCTRLTKEFGWFVDEHSLGSNLNRHRND